MSAPERLDAGDLLDRVSSSCGQRVHPLCSADDHTMWANKTNVWLRKWRDKAGVVNLGFIADHPQTDVDAHKTGCSDGWTSNVTVPTISVEMSNVSGKHSHLDEECISVGEADLWSDERRSYIVDTIQFLVQAFANRAMKIKERIMEPPTPTPTPPPSEDDEEEEEKKDEDQNPSNQNPEETKEEPLQQPEPKRSRMMSVKCCRMPTMPKVFEPQSKIYISWLLIVSLCYLYNAWFIFLRAIFPYNTPDVTPFYYTMDYLSDLVYVIDIVVFKSRIKFLQDGLWVEDSTETRKNYMKQAMFKMDVISLLPLDLLYFVIGPNTLLRFPRLLKIQTFWEFFMRIDAVAKSPYVIRVFHSLLYMMFLIHLNACVYYAISTWEGIGSNGFVFKGEGNAYVRCFYFAIKCATSIGKNQKPENKYEYVYMTFSWLMGVFVFAFLIGQIRDIVATATKTQTQFRNIMDQTVRYLQNLNLPDDLQRRVRLWLNHTWEQQKTFDENAILDSLPIKMKGDVALSVHYQTLIKIQMFKDCEKGFLSDLVLKIRPILFLPGDYVCRKGEIGKDMYIVNKGHVQVLGGEKSDIVLVTLTEGSVFGEISLLGIPGYDRRTADVRSSGFSYLFMLSKEDLWDALKTYPDVENALKKKAKMLIKENLERARAENAKSLMAETIIRDTPRRPSTPRLVKTVLQVVSPDSRCAQLLTGGKQQASKNNSPGSSQPSVRNSLSSASSLPHNNGPDQSPPEENNSQNFLNPKNIKQSAEGMLISQSFMPTDMAVNIPETLTSNLFLKKSSNAFPFPVCSTPHQLPPVDCNETTECFKQLPVTQPNQETVVTLPADEERASANDFDDVDEDWTSSILSLNSLFRKSTLSLDRSVPEPGCPSPASSNVFTGYDNLTFVPNENAASRKSSFVSDMSI